MHFSQPDRTLYGTLQVPSRDANPQVGIALCYPFGSEYLRIHLAFRQLAARLSRAGFAVLRFDYYGTGDSDGDGTEASIDQWCRDTVAALDELKRQSGAATVYLIGLRLGAAVAAEVASHRHDVGRLVLWDPVTNGQRYLDEIRNSPHTEILESTWWVEGFPLPAAMRAEIERIDTHRLVLPESTRVLEVYAGPSDIPERTDDWEGVTSYERKALAIREHWQEPDGQGGLVVPAEIIREIFAWLTH
jgi:pimeloyl-ACP methyl ester carboxylesterase